MAERVEPAPVGIPGVVGEVGAADELARAAERADPDHAGVDQRDVDAGAGEPGLLGPGRGADQVHRGAGAGRAVVGLGDDRGDRVGDRVLHDADGVLARRDRIGHERRAGGVLRGVGDRLVGDLVGRGVGGDVRGRRGDRGRVGVDPGAVLDSVSAVSRATLRTAADRRSRGSAAAGTRAAKPWMIEIRLPTSPPSRWTSRAAARSEPGWAPTTTVTRGAACAPADPAPSTPSMRNRASSGRMIERVIPRPIGAFGISFSDFLRERKSAAGTPGNRAAARSGALVHQSSRVWRRCSSAAARASRIGPSSKRSTSSAMKPSITSRVEVAWSRPRERR